MLNQINHIVSAGSVEGVLTSAVVIRNAAVGCTVEFTQAFDVKSINPTTWEPNRNVVFIDLAVNNQDETMTVKFVARVLDAGHQIVGICDEHDAEAWNRVLISAGLAPADLIIKPRSQMAYPGGVYSSGEVFLEQYPTIDTHTVELCNAAADADRMNFSSFYAGWVNKAIKSNIKDNSRRVYLAQHFAFNTKPDETISAWIAEYEEIEAIHAEIIQQAQDLGNGLIFASGVGYQKYDPTTIMLELYKRGASVVCLHNPNYVTKGGTIEVYSFGVNTRLVSNLDAMDELKKAGLPCFGFAQRVNVEVEYANQALEVIKGVLE